MADLDLIRSVAEEVRYWAEGRAAGTVNESDLTGWCAIASAQLWRKLRDVGVLGELHVWLSCTGDTAHVFVVVDDVVVDVTATQFSRMRADPVYIEHLRVAQHWDWYHAAEIFETPEQLIKWQKRSRWIAWQVAWSEEKSKRKK